MKGATMSVRQVDVVVAGYTCLDIIPTLGERHQGMSELFIPGQLVAVGPIKMSPGGAVSNTGLALHSLNVPTRLIGKIGDDSFGRAIIDLINGYDPALTDGIIISEEESTAYTLVIDPPSEERMFLIYNGPNRTLGADDIDYYGLEGVKIYHFGYPSQHQRLYERGGKELISMFKKVKNKGLTTSLDLTLPDPESDAGKLNWPNLLEHLLPYVDLFLPSLAEALFMLSRERYTRMLGESLRGDVVALADGTLLSELSELVLNMGPAVVLFKLGSHGLYIRTTDEPGKLSKISNGALLEQESWLNREFLVPCFRINVTATVGAGDTTIAGFLTGLLNSKPLEQAATVAAAIGACSMERINTNQVIPCWENVFDRIQSGWERCNVDIPLPEWTFHEKHHLWLGPNDVTRR
jgi:sugar/nucleoside kinase (ribokinase family)